MACSGVPRARARRAPARRDGERCFAQGLTRIELEVYESNQPAIALYERYGFAHEGRKRRGRILDGRSEDIVCMALLREQA